MRSTIVTVVVAAVGLATGAAATADYLTGNPKVCSLHRETACARNAAVYTLVSYMRHHVTGSWSNPVRCVNPSGLLRWRCDYGPGVATVTFRATSSGWRRTITFVCDDPARAKPRC